jgi:hypothetical protein
MGPVEERWTVTENRSLRFFLIVGMAALFLAGIVPVM